MQIIEDKSRFTTEDIIYRPVFQLINRILFDTLSEDTVDRFTLEETITEISVILIDNLTKQNRGKFVTILEIKQICDSLNIYLKRYTHKSKVKASLESMYGKLEMLMLQTKIIEQ